LCIRNVPFASKAIIVEAINYYNAVRIAYQNSEDVREYLRCAIEDINKDLQIIWKFTYRILNFERRIKIVNKDDVDNLLVSWTD
jgi:DNA-binding PadR family transcriptional regulator